MAGIPGVLPPEGSIAVIFVALRTDRDDAGYGEAANRMDELARTQPGYLGIDSVRGADGLGITVSYWADEASARGWKAFSSTFMAFTRFPRWATACHWTGAR